MKVVTPLQITDIESLAILDGSSQSDFMEEAGSGVALLAHEFVEKYNLDRNIVLLCGKGNNGGDAYVAGVHLLHLDYDVIAIQAAPIDECSHLCKQSYQRFLHEGGHLAEESNPKFPKSGLIIDGLFGTGFKGVVKDPYAYLINLANQSHLPILAVDIPSGLNGETGEVLGNAIIARETAFLGLPKRGFFLRDGWNYVGKLRHIDFGLPKQYIEGCESDMIMLTEEMVKPLLPPIKRNRHKYEAGAVAALAGSFGMPGAAILACTAAYRAGAGIVHLYHPKGMEAELATSPYELIRRAYPHDCPLEKIEAVAEDMAQKMNLANAILIGPGIGRDIQTIALLKALLKKIKKPCILDADALTILADEQIAFPEHTILTPHHGEMCRLLKILGHPVIDESFLKACRDYSSSNQVTLVLKGGPTFIFHPGQPIIVNPTGDPGMATAGSGDVLTGLLAGLLAQHSQNSPLEEVKDNPYTFQTAMLGVYLHGLAGEHAAEEMTSYGLMASDIIYHFPEAFKFYEL